ncbi:MAG: helix-turn-helix transcriptional regulator [Erysipelotrichaceae bacterium]|nr:helix-turn-helix transcriptional regulator [Erysipelotrichaceae bacterium]
MGLIGENIKNYRIEKGMTQKELADKLFVTAQAVSRWENNEVEPSLNTIVILAEIFEVSVDELCGKEKPVVETQVVNNYVYEEPIKQHLAVCEICNKPIYESDDIVRNHHARNSVKVCCKECHKKDEEALLESRKNAAKSRFVKSFWISGIIAVIYLIVAIIICVNNKNISAIFVNLGIGVSIFTCISCIVLDNNFIGGMIVGIMEWGFVRMPGVIFELSLDGLLWLITVKLLLWILQITIAIIIGLFAIVLGCTLSIIVYPFALVKNIKHPELEA